MKSNLMPLPKLDRDGVYPRWRLALDEIRHGKGHELLQKIRVVLARTFMPGFDGSGFLRDALLDIAGVGAAGGLHRRWGPFALHIRSHLFEPEEEVYQELLRRHAGNDLIKIYPNALSRDAKPITIHITAWPRSSGVFLADPEHLRKIVIKDHLYLENPLERCDMARLAHIRTASEHTFQHRFAAILEALCGPAVPLAVNG